MTSNGADNAAASDADSAAARATASAAASAAASATASAAGSAAKSAAHAAPRVVDPPEEASRGTLAHYAATAEAFREGTRDHDVRQNIAALLRHIRGTAPFAILDLGCGPGRDLKALRDLGHAPIGIDGVAAFAAMARSHSGCEVWEQDFLGLSLPPERFDGIFANASLFHVPSRALPRVLGQLHATLRPDGVLFSSNPRGGNEEGWHRGRYGVYHDLDGWRAHLRSAGFAELEHYYRPDGLPREQQPWLASVWRKTSCALPTGSPGG